MNKRASELSVKMTEIIEDLKELRNKYKDVSSRTDSYEYDLGVNTSYDRGVDELNNIIKKYESTN